MGASVLRPEMGCLRINLKDEQFGRNNYSIRIKQHFEPSVEPFPILVKSPYSLDMKDDKHLHSIDTMKAVKSKSVTGTRCLYRRLYEGQLLIFI
jgi:hypothetical protein